MSEAWKQVDTYLDGLFGMDGDLERSQAAADQAGLPHIQVSPQQGQLLHLLAKAIGARRILELGTLAGFSTIHLARALPEDGQLITLEVDPKHAEVAEANFAAAGLSEKIELRRGPALESLAALHEQQAGPFDLIFIDADKANLSNYFEWALKLARPGGLILVDNVIRRGEILEPQEASAKGAREFLENLAKAAGVAASVIQTVGIKGHDGIAVCLVEG